MSWQNDPIVEHAPNPKVWESDPIANVNSLPKISDEAMGKLAHWRQVERSYRSKGTGHEIEKGAAWLAKRMPFTPWGALDARAFAKAKSKIEKGTATDRDYRTYARIEADMQESQKHGWGKKTFDLATMLPGFGVEFLVTGGPASKIAERSLKLASGASLGFKGGAIAAGAQAAMTPHRMAENFYSRRAKGESVAQSAWKSYVDNFIEMGTERIGGEAVGRIPGVRQAQESLKKWWMAKRGATSQEWSKTLKKMGYHGVMAEVLEERMAEVARGLSTNPGNFETTGDIVNDPAKAFSQISSEIVAFSVPGMSNMLSNQNSEDMLIEEEQQEQQEHQQQPRKQPNRPTKKTIDELPEFLDEHQKLAELLIQDGRSRTETANVLKELGFQVTRDDVKKIRQIATSSIAGIEGKTNQAFSEAAGQLQDELAQNEHGTQQEVDASRNEAAKEIAKIKNEYVTTWNSELRDLAANFGTTTSGLVRKIRNIRKKEGDANDVKKFDEILQIAEREFPTITAAGKESGSTEQALMDAIEGGIKKEFKPTDQEIIDEMMAQEESAKKNHEPMTDEQMDEEFGVFYPDTRGKGKQFHGTSNPITEFHKDFQNESNNIYGAGFYTTDHADTADSYTKKGGGPARKLYRVSEKTEFMIFDLDTEMNDPNYKKDGFLDLFKDAADSWAESVDWQQADGIDYAISEIGNDVTSYGEFLDEIRRSMTPYDYFDFMEHIKSELRKKGFRGFQHTGGRLTGRNKSEKTMHNVVIFWDPHKDVAVGEIENDEDALMSPSKKNPIADAINEQHPDKHLSLDKITEKNAAIWEVRKPMMKAAQAFGSKTRLRVGHMRMKSALGEYYPKRDDTAIKTADDIDTEVHELGHAISEKYLGGKTEDRWANRLTNEQWAELERLGKELYGGRKPTGGYAEEGFAEYLRLWITQPKEAQRKAPNFGKWFHQLQTKNPKGWKHLKQAQAKHTIWDHQGAEGRAKMSVKRNSLKEKVHEVGEKVNRDRAVETVFEKLTPLKVARDHLKSKGITLPASADPYESAKAYRGTSAGITEQFITKGAIDFAGNKVGGSLVDVFETAGAKDNAEIAEQFIEYLRAKRTVELGKNKPSGMSQRDAGHLISKYDTESKGKFKQAEKAYRKWNDQLLDYMGEATPELKAMSKRLKKASSHYLPLQRVFDELENTYNRGKSAAASHSPFKKLKGSGRRIKDPLQAIINNANHMIETAHKHRVLHNLIKASRHNDMGPFIAEVPRKQITEYEKDAQTIIDKLKKEAGDKELWEQVEEAFIDEGVSPAEVMIPFYGLAKTDTSAQPVIVVKNGSSYQWYHVDESIWRALKEENIREHTAVSKLVDAIIAKPLRKTNNVFKTATVAIRPAFVATNTWRDAQTLIMNSDASMKELLPVIAQAYKEAWFGGTLGVKSNGWNEIYDRLAVGQATVLSEVQRDSASLAARITKRGVIAVRAGRKAKDFLFDIAGKSEKAPRIAAMMAKANQLGWKPGDRLTEDIKIQLTKAGKEATVDFTAASDLGKFANQYIPFFNAALQGTRTYGRTIKDRPKTFAKRITGVGLAVALYLSHVGDEEWYEELGDMKYDYWFLPFGDELVMFPKDQTVGMFAGAMEMLFNAAMKDGKKKEVHDFAVHVSATLDPTGVSASVIDKTPSRLRMPVLIETAAEVLQNKDAYTGKNIIPEFLNSDEYANFQKTHVYTSRTAKAIGKVTDISPAQIEHVMFSVGGGVTKDVVRGSENLWDWIKGQNRDTGELGDMPVLGTLFLSRIFRRGGHLGKEPESFRTIENLFNKSMQNYNADKKGETHVEREKRLLLTNTKQAIGNLRYIAAHAEKEDSRALIKEALDLARLALKEHKKTGPPLRNKIMEAKRRSARRKDNVRNKNNKK